MDCYIAACLDEGQRNLVCPDSSLGHCLCQRFSKKIPVNSGMDLDVVRLSHLIDLIGSFLFYFFATQVSFTLLGPMHVKDELELFFFFPKACL